MLSFIIPVFNEEENIDVVIEGIRAVYKDGFEIIVVDDCSNDDTAAVALKSGARVISHPYRIGNGAAVKKGIREAKGEILVLMDGDGQHGPADIPKLVESLNTFDMAVGARNFFSQSSFLRAVANFIYNRFASYVAQFNIKDLTSGFRAIRRKTALEFLPLLPNGFSYPTTITLSLLRSGRTIKYVPVRMEKRKGKSKIRAIKDGAHFLLIILKIATLYSPFRVFIPVSLFLSFLGLGYYAYTFVMFHRFTNMSALLFTSSLIIAMLGLISEQVAQFQILQSRHNDQ